MIVGLSTVPPAPVTFAPCRTASGESPAAGPPEAPTKSCIVNADPPPPDRAVKKLNRLRPPNAWLGPPAPRLGPLPPGQRTKSRLIPPPKCGAFADPAVVYVAPTTWVLVGPVFVGRAA